MPGPRRSSPRNLVAMRNLSSCRSDVPLRRHSRRQPGTRPRDRLRFDRAAHVLDPMSAYPLLSELALIGDRRTAAAIDRTATIWWYCPRRFDAPSIFAGLLEPEKGAWRIELPGARPGGRRYLE